MKSLTVALAGSLLLSLAGCNQAASDNVTADNAAEANAVATSTTDNLAAEATNNVVEGKPGASETAVDANILAGKPVATDASPAEGEVTEKPTN